MAQRPEIQRHQSRHHAGHIQCIQHLRRQNQGAPTLLCTRQAPPSPLAVHGTIAERHSQDLPGHGCRPLWLLLKGMSQPIFHQSNDRKVTQETYDSPR